MSKGNGFNRERAATVLVDAAYTNDERAAEKWGVTRASIWNWRKRLIDDGELLTLFDAKKERFEAEWAQELPNAIRACVDFIKRAALEANHTKPDVIYSIAGALKIVSDIQMSKDIIDARLSEFNRQTREASQPMASAETGSGRDDTGIRAG